MQMPQIKPLLTLTLVHTWTYEESIPPSPSLTIHLEILAMNSENQHLITYEPVEFEK